MVIRHTNCEMLAFTDQVLVDLIRDKGPRDRCEMRFLGFTDVEQSIREDVQTLKGEPALPGDVGVSGWVDDVRTGARPGGFLAGSRSGGRPRPAAAESDLPGVISRARG
jgi:carbonic anhydrase